MKAAKQRLTQEQLQSLTPEGSQQAEYWRNYLPEMYNTMADKGELYPMLKSEGESMQEYKKKLMEDGLYEWEAQEFINEQIYSLPPEEPKRKPRRTKQEKAQDAVYDAMIDLMKAADKLKRE